MSAWSGLELWSLANVTNEYDFINGRQIHRPLIVVRFEARNLEPDDSRITFRAKPQTMKVVSPYPLQDVMNN